MIPNIDVVKAMSNPWVRSIVILFAGITIGAVFYPSSTMKETISKQYQQQIQTLNEQHKEQLEQTTKTYDASISTMKSQQSQSDQKINELSTQVEQLKSSTKTSTYKIVHPDGTVEERTTSEEDVDKSDTISTQIQAEYQAKLAQQEIELQATHQQEVTTLQQQWDQKETTYKQTISSLQETKTVTTNAKKFGVEAGMLLNQDYYGHVSYDIWGPLFLGLHTEIDPANPTVGAGIGLHF